MARDKKPSESFKELVGDVRPLPNEPRVAPSGAPQNVVTVSSVPALRVTELAGEISARAVDAAPGVVRELAQGPLFPYRTLDLHGLTSDELRSTLRKQVPAARKQQLRCLLLICGRGLHSPGEIATLPEIAVTELSVALAGHVLAFRTAPANFGGSGALVVRLRPLS